MLTYLLLIITFVGAVLGLTGKAWDEDKPGPIKFTVRGGISLAVLAIGLCATVANTYKTSKEKDYEFQQRQLVRALAYQELDYACNVLTAPFADMVFRHAEDDASIPRPKSSLETTQFLASKEGIRLVESTNFRDRPVSDIVGAEHVNYIDAVLDSNERAQEALDTVLQKYMMFLEGEDIVLINKIIRQTTFHDLEQIKEYHDRENNPVYWIDLNENEQRYLDLMRNVLQLHTKIFPLARSNKT